MDGFDLREGLLRKLAGLEEKEFGVAQHGGQGVVDVVLHVDHVAAESGVVLVARGLVLSGAGEAQGFGAAEGFSGDEQKRLGPVFAQGNVHEAGIARAQLGELAGICRSAEDYGAGGVDGPENLRDFDIAQWADHDEVVRSVFVFFPKIAGKDGDGRGLPLGLPTGGEEPGELGFISEDEYVEVWQRLTTP